ncbi:MAG: iron-containing alcohol dehydrogenase [Bacillota bacterium]
MKRFFFPTELYSAPGSIREMARFIKPEDKVLLITDRMLVKLGLAKRVTDVIDGVGAKVEVFDDVPANPHADCVNSALEKAKTMGATAIVCLGGGSPMDVAKVVAMLMTNEGTWEQYQWEGRKPEKAPLPYIAIPTTAGTGSEASKTSVIIDRDTKKGVGGDFFFAKVTLIDPELMVSLPPFVTATTGMDALTHAIEAYVGRSNHPFTNALALEAISLLTKYLPVAYENGADLEAREMVALAASMAGLAMDQSGLGVIHSMSGPLSSHYNVAHGLSNAVLLPCGMRYNVETVPERYARVAEALGVNTYGISALEAGMRGIEKVEELCTLMKIPTNLCEYFREEEDICKFADEACKMFLMRNNPRTPQQSEIEELFAGVLKA